MLLIYMVDIMLIMVAVIANSISGMERGMDMVIKRITDKEQIVLKYIVHGVE